jgi:RNA-directed DNA polymerase
MTEPKRYNEITPEVPKARQGEEIEFQKDWSWVEATVWTNRMLAALENGVKGGKGLV